MVTLRESRTQRVRGQMIREMTERNRSAGAVRLEAAQGGREGGAAGPRACLAKGAPGDGHGHAHSLGVGCHQLRLEGVLPVREMGAQGCGRGA
jgi:hypothetical protein